MLSRADSLGVFQVESRAQMTMLPRLKPQRILRSRHRGRDRAAGADPGRHGAPLSAPALRAARRSTYPSEELRRVLEKTLGVPLFQEQAMKIAIVGAGFPPGGGRPAAPRDGDLQAQRRHPPVPRQVHRRHGRRTATTAISRPAASDQIEGFGTYGFPESHAASFALLVYVSAWIKCFYPEVFACALLNSQPMGFYAPAQIVRDAREHGVEVRPVDVNFSDWDCTLEPYNSPSPPDARAGPR